MKVIALIDNIIGVHKILTKGKSYEVLQTYFNPYGEPFAYNIIDDLNTNYRCYACYVETIEDIRHNKIKRLLDNESNMH